MLQLAWHKLKERIRVSLRFSILSIMTTLLLTTSAIVLWFSTKAAYDSTLDYANKFITASSNQAAERFKYYLSPLTNIPQVTDSILQHQMLKLHDRSQTLAYFTTTLVAYQGLEGIYYGDIHGNFHLLNRLDDGSLYELDIVRKNKQLVSATQGWLDAKGKTLFSKAAMPTPTDPSTRYWFKHAKNMRPHTFFWSKAQFANNGRRLAARDGITAILPITDANNNVTGAFCVDVLSDAIEHFFATLPLPKDSVLLVYNNAGEILWHFVEGQPKFAKEAAYTLPAVAKLLNSKESKFDHTFDFRINLTQYLAVVQSLTFAKTQSPWFLAIISPVDSLVQNIRINLFRALLLAVCATLLGLLSAMYFSDSISNPVNKLVRDSNLICALELEAVQYQPSIIKEIDNMGRAFINMKNALSSFRYYMPVDLVRQLVESGQIAHIDGDKRQITVMFSDIRSFTDIAEKLAPEDLMQYLSNYFQCVSSALIRWQGTIDKYIGDSVMCFWGAPKDDAEQAVHACAAILEIKKELAKLSKTWVSQKQPVAFTRFGINTGMAVVGNVGSNERLNYTAIGDTVNLASRLESINKMYGTEVAVSEATYTLVKHQFKFRLIDHVRVKGKDQATYFYELLDEAHPLWAEVDKYNAMFKIGFVNYVQGKWPEAIKAFEELLSEFKEDNLTPIFLARCQNFIKKPPEKWEGIWDYAIK